MGLAVNSDVRHPCHMARGDPHFRLRIPEELKRALERAAKRNLRSVNAEIVARLLETFTSQNDPEERLRRRVQELKRRKTAQEIAIIEGELTFEEGELMRALVRLYEDQISDIEDRLGRIRAEEDASGEAGARTPTK
ncbi:Arc family DNA-binding protein [Nostoc sp. NIES-2111]